jgi:DNA-binding XRE family transcriptional regulator
VEYCTCIKLKVAKQKLQTELSLQQKSEVLLRIQKGESQRKLAEQYGMSKMTIANIAVLPAMVGWRRFGIGTISTSGHYAVNLLMLTKKQQMI